MLYLLLGILFLWLGSDFTIKAAKDIAIRLNITYTLVGLTIISIGTSLPEIFTNIIAGIKTTHGLEASGVAVGTNIGSCVTQITLILGLTALIGTMYTTKQILRRDGRMVLVAIAAMFFSGLDGYVSKTEGLLLCIAYISYIIFISKRDHVYIKKEFRKANYGPFITIVMLILGITMLILGSKLVVENAIAIANKFNLQQSFIGIMIIGLGTGLPELSTALTGILKKAEDISLGTLIGSNITDPMFSLGSGALISGFGVEKNLLYFDLPYWFFATIVALLLMKRKMRIGKEDRKKGILLIILYIIFVIIKIKFFI